MYASAIRTAGHQRGMVIPLLAVGMAVLVGMSGLALDLGNTYVNKSRLQNLVDAAALTAAKTLDESGDTQQARDSVSALFDLTAASPGNEILSRKLSADSLIVEFSDALYPFIPGGANPQYVRVRVDAIPFDTWLVRVLGTNQTHVAASAVSGPSPTLDEIVCDAVPVMVCGEEDNNPDDDMYFGYRLGDIQILKTTAGGNGRECVGPGNFQLIRLGEAFHGGNDVRHTMAGDYGGCTEVGTLIETEPGNVVGPVVQGLNTRFGIYLGGLGGMQDVYPPDVNTDENSTPISEPAICGGVSPTDPATLSYSHQSYSLDANLEYPVTGVAGRRILRVPIGLCTGAANGQSEVQLLGVGCFFALQRVVQHGRSAKIYGQFIEDCTLDGVPGPVPDSGPGPYKIILYEDPDSRDS